MAYRFVVDSDSDSSPPSTPDRGSTKRGGSDLFHFDDNPSTTPAGPPPPSSAASFTPAGAPSASYLGSSMMRGVTAQKPASFGSRLAGSGAANKTLFAPKTNSPLGRSIQASAPSAAGKGGRQPSKLSKQFVMSSDEDEDQEEEDQEDDERDAEGDEEDDYLQQLQQDMRSAKDSGPRTFSVRYEDSDEASDAQGEDDLGPYRREDGLGADADAMGEDDVEGDLWLGLDAAADEPMIGDESDLMMMATPAVNDRIRREAEDIFRASAMRSTNRPPREFKFAPIAKAIYDQMGYATITESPEVIIETENLVGRLYNEGVGPEEDANRMDNTLAGTSAELASVWRAYVESMPRREEEHSAGVGPGPNASAFENASYLASLALQVHHTRFDDGGEARLEPLTETMFRWLAENHNLYPGQVRDVLSHQPAPAGHSMFWQTVFVALLQGRVTDALDLLSRGGWDRVRRGHQAAYTGQALANVERAVHETWDMLSGCPGRHGNWEIWSSDWMLFRIRAKGFLEQLRRFAEGRDRGGGDAEMFRGRNSMAGLARKAESQVPWEIYENLNIIFDIVLGVRERIVAMAQDWCEATVALFGWWDEGSRAQQQPQLLSRSQSLVLASDLSSSESYLDRLARSFQAAVGAGLELNSNNPLEVGMACVFEDNPKGVIGILRGWSLPVASAVAEIASLGGWLPPHQPSLMFGMDDLDMDDLEVLGVDPKSPDELDGIKDHTLVQYAQELVNLDELATVTDKSGRTMEGWELAIHVLGRMESPERSEETVGELVRTILEGVDVGSGATVEKVWRLLNDLGMIAFAEETAEHYGDTLAQDSHRYGEAMWYYALAHRPSKVREVMNLLISYSLVQSAAYPPEPELDGYLARLLSDRNATLQRFAKQDLEAAELLGKLLSGYATLRRFYELRDDDDGNDNDGGGSGGPSASLSSRRSAAAVALTAVIASSGDNIRGGMYDAGRGAVVSEDFLLALLGEALMFVDVEREQQPALTLEHIDVLLKAVEDLSSLGGSSRVRAACDEFLGLVLQSAKGLRGAGPADLARSMRKSTSGSYVLGGSSMLASQLHRSIVGGPGGGAGGGAAAAALRRRGWDWRTDERAGVRAGMGGDELLARLRLGLARDLGRLWVAEADGAI
ncbi:uncharacterized protein E0L32_005690 [Thyridium curvatum]|uniref:Nuclear pore complex protein Nup85 n=1 Tax=Thyridium curvatum TaxID=1093900 RepID=A0A507BBK4_9PEZI|nr:uncharacterized protein E0L32_005690 [Thyridium curvatum]TPX13990.1 hypothetical protein E0L32_005690 [Thyridium curvatum]